MKKVLCVLLSLLMAFSVATVAFAAEGEEGGDLIGNLSGLLTNEAFVNALDGKNLTLPASLNNYKDGNGYDMTRIINEKKLDGVYFLGMDLGFLYNTESVLDWGRLSVGHNDISSLYGNIDQYLGYMLRSRYQKEERLCTAANATAICNLIGRMLFANYQKQTIQFDAASVKEVEFYTTIAEKSGLADLIGREWCAKYETNARVEYHPFLLNVLGVDFSNYDAFLYFKVGSPSNDWKKPSELAAYIIKNVIEGAITINPITYLLNGLYNLLRTYGFDMIDTVKGLLSDKIKNGIVRENNLSNFATLFNTLSNNNGRESNHVEYFPVPAYRYTTANDNTEMFLYLLIYLNLLGKHKNNASAITTYRNKVRSGLGGTDKDVVSGIFDAMFFSDLTGLVRLMPTIVEENLDNVGNNLWLKFVSFLTHTIRSITSFFDGIFQTLRNGIDLDKIQI